MEPTATPPTQCPVVETELNKKDYLKSARQLTNIAKKYWGKSGKCGYKKFRIEIRNVEDLFKLFRERIEAFPTEVELCGDDCVEVVTEELLAELRQITKEIGKSAKGSQKVGARVCKNPPIGIRKTTPKVNKFLEEVNECPTHVCPPNVDLPKKNR